MNVSMRHEYRLVGLEPDNLLAFMALLGTLRAIEVVRPQWHPRTRWDEAQLPSRPILALTESPGEMEIADALASACDQLAPSYRFDGRKDLNWSREEIRAYFKEAIAAGPTGRRRAELLSALASDIAVKDDGTIVPTPFCLMFGQGHQHFLERLSSVPALACPPSRSRQKIDSDDRSAAIIAAALFQPWERTDPTPSFRWDPAEDRRYALRFVDPGKDAALTVHGANRLAAMGLPILTVVPRTSSNRIRLAAVGTRRISRGDLEVSWPIWTRALSLSAIRAMLLHPAVHENPLDSVKLRALGIREVRRATRISVGKFMNFTRAVAL